MLQSTCSRTWQRQLIALLFASTACAWTGPPPPDGAVEEESKRTETSRTYVLPNGTHHLIVLATKDAPLPPHEVGDVIDPIFPGDTSDGLIDGSSSNYNAACNTATAATTSGNLQVGRVVSFGPYEIDRSFVAFDTSAITSANTVTSVRMNLMVGGNSSQVSSRRCQSVLRLGLRSR